MSITVVGMCLKMDKARMPESLLVTCDLDEPDLWPPDPLPLGGGDTLQNWVDRVARGRARFRKLSLWRPGPVRPHPDAEGYRVTQTFTADIMWEDTP